MKFSIPAYIRGYLRFILFGLLIFTSFRILLFFLEFDRLGDASIFNVFYAFFMGFRFDMVVLCYAVLLPFTLSSIHNLIYGHKILAGLIHFLIALFFPIVFMVSTADIPYFHQFFERLSISAFTWKESPLFVAKMVAQESRYALFIIPLALALFLYYKFHKKNKGLLTTILKPKKISHYLIFLLCAGLLILGMRGRIEQKSPIRLGTAYFCSNPFLNMLGLNPNFTLLRTYLDEKKFGVDNITFMDSATAIDNVRKSIGASSNSDFPIVRDITADSTGPKKYNVVLILMESMSSHKMTRGGNKKSLTPFLDSLSNEGIYCENAYSTGIHTFNGIYSTLTSYPSFFRMHSMQGVPVSYPGSLMKSLSDNDYSTAYFTTHDDQFDNVGGFMKANYCDQIISVKDYPSSAVKTTLGVPDGYMFDFSMPYLNEMYDNGKPFLATFMTASDHGPYYVPPSFECRHDDIKSCVIEYADNSLHEFFDNAKSQPWFDNTLFVFVADHGESMTSNYDISLAFTHIPILFYAPGLIDSAMTYSNMASQMDVYPTIMGLLNLDYTNYGFGLDLMKDTRKYSLFTANDKMGLIDQQHYYIKWPDGKSFLYNYTHLDRTTLNDSLPEVVTEMDNYSDGIFQAYKEVLKRVKATQNQ